MPRLYIHLIGRTESLFDSVGIDCANLREAKAAAIETARIMIQESGADGIDLGLYFEICGEKQEVLDVVPFASVMN